MLTTQAARHGAPLACGPLQRTALRCALQAPRRHATTRPPLPAHAGPRVPSLLERPRLALPGASARGRRDGPTLPPPAGPGAAAFFAAHGFSGEEQAQVLRCLDGVHLKTLAPPGLATTGGRALAGAFVRMFFKDLVEQHPRRSEFAGETVVAASPAVPQRKAGADYLMWFGRGAQQAPHWHPGERYLVLFAPAGLKLLLGGSDPGVLARERVPFARVAIPPGIAVLSFAKPDVIHGFIGAEEEGFGAISHHGDDFAEIVLKLEALRAGGAAEALQDIDLMGLLTDYVPPDKVRVIRDTDIPASVVDEVASRRKPY